MLLATCSGLREVRMWRLWDQQEELQGLTSTLKVCACGNVCFFSLPLTASTCFSTVD